MFKHLVGKSICYGHVDFVHFDLLGAKEIHLPLKKMPEKYKFGEFLDAKIYQGFVQGQNGSWRRVYVLLKINSQDIIETSLIPSQDVRDWQDKINTEMKLETKKLLSKMLEKELAREKYFELFVCLGITGSLEDVKITLINKKYENNIEKYLPKYQNPYRVARCFSRHSKELQGE